jgi:hypothetical protein
VNRVLVESPTVLDIITCSACRLVKTQHHHRNHETAGSRYDCYTSRFWPSEPQKLVCVILAGRRAATISPQQRSGDRCLKRPVFGWFPSRSLRQQCCVPSKIDAEYLLVKVSTTSGAVLVVAGTAVCSCTSCTHTAHTFSDR